MREATEADWIEYGRYADGMAADAMAGKAFPVNFATWMRREDRLRGDQLTLNAGESGTLSSP